MITKNTVVSLGYRLTNAEGKELDSASSSDPLSYLHGHKQIVPGLENALEGLLVGDKKEVSLSPEEGYGQVIPELRLKLPRTQFPEDMEITPGLQFEANLGDNHHVFTIIGEDGDDVNIDGNHPLAGQALNFSVEVLGIRPATEEEIQHGHSHDGHSHH
jgi:FKBP-type peptidyl-prolyl cis-trans isomerase SlyD